MSESSLDATIERPEDIEALNGFVVENDDLERLEALIAQFNIFEALGAVRHELRHSDLLAFLLDPTEPHGLGDAFLKRLLQRVLVEGRGVTTTLNAVEIDLWDADDVEVRREWRNIDILVVDRRRKLAVVVENKIDTGEHSGQLERYFDLVAREFAGFRQVGILLSPDGDAPTDARYTAVDYKLIAELVSKVVEIRASTIKPDVRTLLIHYVQMLGRHIVTDTEIADLCTRLYRKHRRALDLIFEHRPDRQADVRDVLEDLVKASPGLVLDQCSKQYVRFTPRDWDVAVLKQGAGWTRTGRMLLFEFSNLPSALTLKLVVGPGPAETRERLLKMANSDLTLFKGAGKTMWKKWNQLFNRAMVPSNLYDAEDDEPLMTAIRQSWDTFVSTELPKIQRALKSEEWLWHQR